MENRVLRTIATLEALLIMGTACEARRPEPVAATPTREPVPTATLPEAKATAVVLPTETVEPTTAPITPQERIRLGAPLTMVMELVGGPIELSVMPLIVDEQTQAKFNAYEDGISLVNPHDKYGNMVFQVHSGWAKRDGEWRQLPAEGLRVLVQGGNGSGALAEYDLATQDQLIAGLEGTPVLVDQDGRTENWRIGAAQRVARRDIKDFRRDTYKVVDRLIGYAARDNRVSSFTKATKERGVVLIISLRARREDNSSEKWSHEALVLYLVP